MKKKHFLYALFVAAWLGGLWYCKTQTDFSDWDVQQQLNDTLLIDHSKLLPVDTMKTVPDGK